jgi:hypothetical protein
MAEKEDITNINTDESDENYKFKTQVSRRLSKLLNVPEFPYDENFKWEPPDSPGLQNCNIIIEPYYHLHKEPHKITTLDYLEIIKDDIRNFRHLNEYKMEYIKTLPDRDKNELFDIFNDCIKTVVDISGT